jgi:hypothetical protein
MSVLHCITILTVSGFPSHWIVDKTAISGVSGDIRHM